MRPLVVVLGLVLIAVAGDARADVPPDPDSADAHCTKAEQCPNGVFCAYQNNAEDPKVKEETESCIAAAKAKGLAHRCTDGGGTVGSELYCPKGETGSWSPGCTRCSIGSAQGAWPVWLVLALGALAVARRRC